MERYVNHDMLLHCDFCDRSETEDIWDTLDWTAPLIPMYKLDDGCLLCQHCLDAAEDVQPDEIVEGNK